MSDDRTTDVSDLKLGSELATQYLRSECGATICLNTAKTYQSNLKGYLAYLERNSTDVLTVESQSVRSFLKMRARQNRREESIRNDLTAIRGLYKWIRLESEEEAQIDYLYLKEIDAGRFLTPPAIERKPLEREELEMLYDELGTLRDRLLVTVGAELGPRSIDLREIKIRDVDFDNRSISLSDTKNKDEYSLPISDPLAVELDYWLSVHRPTYPYSDDHGFLFPSQEGGSLSGERLLGIVQKAASSAGIQETLGISELSPRQQEALGIDSDVREWKKVTVHALRHTFSHLMKEAGIPPEGRRDALNHDSVETTEKYYSLDDTEYKDLIRELLHSN